MGCCDGKPVSLNHLNKGETHLADDIPIHDDGKVPLPIVEMKLTTVKAKSTRRELNVQTTVIILNPDG